MKIRARPAKGERPDRCKTWRLYWELPLGVDGQRRQVTETFHGTKDEAKERWRNRQGEIDGKRLTQAPSKQTVAQYLEDWLRSAAGDIEATTAESYGRMVKHHIVPAIGRIQLGALTPVAVQRMVDAMRAGTGHETRPLSPRTCAYARTVLRIALQEAVRLGVIPMNPADHAKAPKQAPRRVVAFTVGQAAVLLAQAEGMRTRDLFEFAWLTGLRRGELLALRWGDVDLEAKTATIRRARVALDGTSVEKGPKTEAGIRTVALPARAIEVLRRQKATQAAEQLEAGPAFEDDDLVFATALGHPFDPRNVSRDFRHARDSVLCPGCKHPTSPEKRERGSKEGPSTYLCRHCGRGWKADGLPKLPFHALRHSAVSVQLAAGVPLEIVSKRIGHRKLGTTADIYGHLLPEANQEAAAAVDAFLDRATAANAGAGSKNGPGNGPGTPRMPRRTRANR